MKIYLILYQNVLIETRQDLVLIRFFDVGVNFYIFGCGHVFFYLKTVISKTASLTYVFDKVPSAK